MDVAWEFGVEGNCNLTFMLSGVGFALALEQGILGLTCVYFGKNIGAGVSNASGFSIDR